MPFRYIALRRSSQWLAAALVLFVLISPSASRAQMEDYEIIRQDQYAIVYRQRGLTITPVDGLSYVRLSPASTRGDIIEHLLDVLSRKIRSNPKAEDIVIFEATIDFMDPYADYQFFKDSRVEAFFTDRNQYPEGALDHTEQFTRDCTAAVQLIQATYLTEDILHSLGLTMASDLTPVRGAYGPPSGSAFCEPARHSSVTAARHLTRHWFTVSIRTNLSEETRRIVASGAPLPERLAEPQALPSNPALMLTVTTSGSSAAPPPERVVVTPRERPEPPAAPQAAPCARGQGCVTAEGAPPTAEALAYRQQLKQHEGDLRAFEASEAAERERIVALNAQRQEAYTAGLEATRKREAQEAAAREAKFAADQAEYDARLAAHRAETERLTREHEQRTEEWRRRTAACLAGDQAQCAN